MKFSNIKKAKPAAPETPAPASKDAEPAAPRSENLSKEESAASPEPVKPPSGEEGRPRAKGSMSYTQLFMAKFPALARKAAAGPRSPEASAKPKAARSASPALPPFPIVKAPVSRPAQAQAAARERDLETARAAYGRAVSEVKALLHDIPLGQVNVKEGLGRAVVDCLELLKADNQALVAMTAHSTAGNYLYAHSANVSILSMHIGLGLGLEAEALRRLGLAAILQDIGMAKYLGLASETRALSLEEQHEVRLHPIESLRLVGFIEDIGESTRRLLSEVIASRLPGQSQPSEPKPASAESRAAAQIIALCEIYEALCHYRNWREPILPHMAVKRLIKEQASDFDRRLIQKFVERVSLFPPGSYVELSSGEIACVLETHSKTPTLPTVELRLRGDESPSPPTIINLAENPLTHIKRAVDETKLPLKDKKTLLAFQAARWWVD